MSEQPRSANVLRSRRSFVVVTALCCIALASRADAPVDAEGWSQSAQEDGVTLWERDIPGADLPGFRGQSVMNEPASAIVAVIEDVARHTQWMYRCNDAGLLQILPGDAHAIIYNRTEGRWPVWDRDVILETVKTTSADGAITTLTFRNVDSALKAVPSHVVRMPHLKGLYRVEALDPTHSRVTYQVEADPGGRLPTWIARHVVHEMPRRTLTALRTRLRQ